MIDGKGRIITHEEKNFLGMDHLSLYPLMANNQEERSIREVNANNSDYIAITSEKNKLGWQIIELMPVMGFYYYRTSIISIFLIAGFIVSLFAIALTWILSIWVSRPIVNLSAIMQREAVFEIPDIEVYSKMNNEIGTLYSNYHYLIIRINKLIEELKISMNTMRIAEINALQAQINPHFMYNTLDYISWVALDNNVPRISWMLTVVSRFLRASLGDSSPFCELSKEIEHVKSYVEIFQARYENNFLFSVNVPDQLLHVRIPKFILQPLIENSILHGFEKKIDGARIEVDIKADNHCLVFEVYDNGKGMTAKQLRQILESDQPVRYGLKNLDERLGFLCGDKYSGLTLAERNKGTCIHFEIPEDCEAFGGEYAI
jgi:two-component system sensor histidine kinase YesM